MSAFRQTALVNRFPVLDALKYSALAASLISALAFSRQKSALQRQPILKYILAVSISDVLYSLSMIVALPLLSACADQKEQNSSANADLQVCRLYFELQIYLGDYLTSCLALFNIVVEVLITFQRMILLTG